MARSTKQKFFQSTLALSLIAGLVGACAETAPERETSDGSTNVQTEEVAENTEGYIGQIVTIRSAPVEKVGDNSFTVNDEQFFGSEPILVINASGEPLLLPEGDVEVQVTGEVRNFLISEVNQEFDLTLDQNLYEEYEDQPVIIAQSIALAPEPGEISENPEQYYGETLAVTGDVEDIQSEDTFTLQEDQLLGADSLLVVYAQPKAGSASEAVPPTITDNEQVAVTGVLRPFVVSELERDYDLTWDAEVLQQLEADYSEKPVLIATQIYPSAIPE
ncbi:hypothetical protein [Nodosilinea sp. FACHB-13]|uniref:hypothetical protein n=1 Tax=Cyanophyceae TaxID=3028117 RepID=UPI00168641AD|nr:hypothetical protein [Nodosilinea sp. FACHB-13]MBD2105512.1 hypothetical protein [Nodosilinea sp. FACHB-13]